MGLGGGGAGGGVLVLIIHLYLLYFSQNSSNDETVFRQTMQSTSFHTFASAKFYRNALYDTFISLGRNGKARNGKYTTSAQNKVKFLILTADSC